MVVTQTPPDFGGYAPSMRYLLPIIPFTTIMSAAFISKATSDKTTGFFVLILPVSSLVFYASGFEMGSKTLSLVLSASLMVFALLYNNRKNEIARSILVIFLVLAVLQSNFMNITDVKTGNQQRDRQSGLERLLMDSTGEGSAIILPNTYPITIDERILVYYPHLESSEENRGEVIEEILDKAPNSYILLRENDNEIVELAKRRNATFHRVSPNTLMAVI
jgi:hypothetical protein